MAYYKQWGHTTYDCRYHIVWVTKFRKKRITEDLKEYLTEILEEVCEELFVKIIRIWMEEDHAHFYVSIPLTTGYIPEVVQKLKWRTSKILWEMEDLKRYFKQFYWKDGVWKWAVWYFICTVWEVNDKLIKEYIEEQGQNPLKADKSPAL